MKAIDFRSVKAYDVCGEQICEDKCKIRVRTESITVDGCSGVAVYIDVSSEIGMSGRESVALFPDILDTSHYLAIQNHSPYWCRPFWGDSLSELPEKVQELVLEENGRYRVILPVCDKEIKALICGDRNGVKIYITTNLDGMTHLSEQLCFVYFEDAYAEKALAAAAKSVPQLLKNGMLMRNERRYPQVFDKLGWCSWDAFQIRVNHDGLVQKAKEFAQKGVPIGFAIIDDMWADVPELARIPKDVSFHDMVHGMHASRMRSFEGDPDRFPQGMKAAVSALKDEGIENVGIWFPTTGYWYGFTEDGAGAKELGDTLEISSEGRYTVSADKDKAERYFDTLCGKTKAWGADFVKIDNQGFHFNYKNKKAYGQSAEAIQSAIESACDKYFDGALINCMGMPSECLFHRKDSSVCRCSDDFIPESRDWFAKNILQCAYNGLMQGQYHVNDWDMWWTDDEQAVKNSLCRAISGGPIYVSDKLGRTNADILLPLALKDGRIIRCDDSATPTADCLMSDPTKREKVFKIKNRIKENAVIAVYNINAENKVCIGTVSPSEAGLESGRYAYYEYFTKSFGILEAGQSIDVELKNNDEFRLYTFVPMQNGIAVMGRTDLFMGVGAVCREGDTVKLAEGGRIAFVSEREFSVIANGKELEISKFGIAGAIETDENEIRLM